MTAAERPIDKMMGNLLALITEHGWAVQGVFGSTVEETFSYTVGLTDAGLPELFIASLDPRQATPILNGLARVALAHQGGLPVGEPIDIDWSIPFVLRGPVMARDAEAFAATRLYGEDAVEVMQVLWSDPAGLLPTEDGYDTAAFPQRLLPVVPNPAAGYNDAMTETENQTESTSETTEVSVELPAKVTETTEVVTTSETAASDGEPDAATQAMEAEKKE